MFTEEQKQILDKALDSNRIRSREKGNINLSYLEGFDVIETANHIFGYGNWSYTITKLEQVSQETNQNQNRIVCYQATLKVRVYHANFNASIVREDVGFGTGIAKTLAEAHEGGAKEAVTDALKRALRSFGNQFGNSLYDKRRNHQQNLQQTTKRPATSQNNQIKNNIPTDYSKLYNLGLTIVEQGDNIIVVGEDIFAKKDTIKACGFRWDGVSRLWYKPIEQQQAA